MAVPPQLLLVQVCLLSAPGSAGVCAGGWVGDSGVQSCACSVPENSESHAGCQHQQHQLKQPGIPRGQARAPKQQAVVSPTYSTHARMLHIMMLPCLQNKA